MSKTGEENKKDQYKITTGVLRLNYANLLKARFNENKGKDQFSTVGIIQKSDKETIKAIKRVVNELIRDNPKIFGRDPQPGSYRHPLRDGDRERSERKEFADAYFINASSNFKPGVIDLKGREIIDEDEVYSGMYARLSLKFFAYDEKGNKGIGCQLNHVLKVKDGERIGGNSAADAFADFIVKDAYDEDDDEDEDGDKWGDSDIPY